MSSHTYRYALELHKADGRHLSQVPLSVDWDPAIESAWLFGLRRNRLQPTDGTRASTVHPCWHKKLGKPYIDGFAVDIPTAEGSVRAEFATAYFRSSADAASASFVEKGELEKGEIFRYLVLAFSTMEEPEAGPKLSFNVHEIAPPLPLRHSTLARFTGVASLTEPLAGVASLAVARDDSDIPVFIPQQVLDETRELSRGAGTVETGGALIGHLHRDRQVPEAFVEVTAQLPAKYAVGQLHSLTFTAETWTDVRSTIDLRNRQEILLGWWHRHPVAEWCKNCPTESQKVCPLANNFLSEDDRQLHRTVFPRGYTVALVVNDVSFRAATHSLFGWRQGLLEPRGFYLMNDAHLSTETGASIEDSQPASKAGASTEDSQPASKAGASTDHSHQAPPTGAAQEG